MAVNVAGQSRPYASLPGSTRKVTELVRANLKTAVEILRNGDGQNPVEAAQKIARFLEGISQKRMEHLANNIGAMNGKEFDRVVDTLYKAANIQLRLADYVFPKPGRIDLPEPNGASKQPRSIDELTRELEERGLPSWVFGEDVPSFDLTAEEVNGDTVVEANGRDANGNGGI